jgi:hypothetical protein
MASAPGRRGRIVDICFVNMPFAAIQRPAIVLGLLKAILEDAGIQSTTLYANIHFAQARAATYGLKLQPRSFMFLT